MWRSSSTLFNCNEHGVRTIVPNQMSKKELYTRAGIWQLRAVTVDISMMGREEQEDQDSDGDSDGGGGGLEGDDGDGGDDGGDESQVKLKYNGGLDETIGNGIKKAGRKRSNARKPNARRVVAADAASCSAARRTRSSGLISRAGTRVTRRMTPP